MFSLSHSRTAAAFFLTITTTVVVSLHVDRRHHAMLTYLLWWAASGALVVTIIVLTIAIERRRHRPSRSEEMSRRRAEAVGAAQAMTTPQDVINHLTVIGSQLRGFLRLRSLEAPGFRAWLKRRRLRRQGVESQWIARSVHGPVRYQRQTVSEYLRDYREPLAQPIYRAVELGYVDAARTGLINGPETVEDLWKAAKAVSEYIEELQALVEQSRQAGGS